MSDLIFTFLNWLKNWFLRCPACKHVHRKGNTCGVPLPGEKVCGCQTEDEA